MMTAPIVAVVSAAVILGVYLGVLFLKGIRRTPVLIGLHLLLGAAALEMCVMLLHGPPSGVTVPEGPYGRIALVLFAGAMFSGLLTPMLFKHSRQGGNAMLATHAGVGLAGFGLFLAWVTYM